MIVFVNGQFVPEEQAVVSVFDRGFLYGDGLFETIRVFNGKPFRWAQHLERLQQGAEFLKIALPYPPAALREFAQGLITQNKLADALMRLTVSRGIGPRGYSPKNVDRPTLVISLHPAPRLDGSNLPAWRLVTSSFRIPANEPLARFKNCNKLPQILARAEADAVGADEALVLNSDGCVVEGASSNLFWIHGGTVCTPPLTSGILPGVTRMVVMELCHRLGLPLREDNMMHEELRETEGVFLSLSSIGIAEAASLDEKPLVRSAIATRIFNAYWETVRSECA